MAPRAQDSAGALGLEFFRELVELAPWGAIVADTTLEGRCHYVNPEFTAIMGYTLEDIPTVGGWLEKAYPDPDYRAMILANWVQDVDPQNMRRDVVYRVRCKDGTERSVQLRAAALENGRMLVSLLDATERIQAQRARDESEQRYRVLVDTAPLGIAVHSGGRIVFANRHALQVLGAPSEAAVVGRPIMDFIHPDSRAVVAERVREVYENPGTLATIEERFLRSDGEALPVQVTATQVEIDGRSAGLVVFADISERVQAEADRRALEEQVRYAQKLESLGVLAGGVAHDFNNLLVAILGRTELARLDAREESSVHEHLEAVESAARQAADLARQMLAYAGKGRFDVRRVDLGQVIADTRRLIGVSVSRRATLQYELADGLPPTEADATQVRQILLNLITNASEALAGAHGVITVRTGLTRCDAAELQRWRAHPDAHPGRFVFLEVADTGVGMDEETQARVFDPFFTTKFTGRGLGLAAVLGIVRGHGGAIEIESAPGEGTRFRALFPAASGPAAVRQRTADASDWTTSGTALVVDDDPTVRDVATVMLERLGLVVEQAEDGLQALARFEEAPDRYRIVLLDLTMPRLDGRETLAAMRRIRPDVCVLLSSGYGEIDVDKEGEAAIGAGFVAKPYTFRGLATAVRAALESASG